MEILLCATFAEDWFQGEIETVEENSSSEDKVEKQIKNKSVRIDHS